MRLFFIPFQVLSNVGKTIQERTFDACDAIPEANNRRKMYMGHVQRVVNHDRRMAIVMDIVRSDDIWSSVLVSIEFKMKFEPNIFRETSTELFWKRGMSWYGSVMFYRRKYFSEVDDVHDVQTREEELSTLAIDHILKL